MNYLTYATRGWYLQSQWRVFNGFLHHRWDARSRDLARARDVEYVLDPIQKTILEFAGSLCYAPSYAAVAEHLKYAAPTQPRENRRLMTILLEFANEISRGAERAPVEGNLIYAHNKKETENLRTLRWNND
jgi:hypothetical protein